MTAEQAIKHLEDSQRLYLGNEKFTADVEAIGIAIKVLEQQPCDDCINREATIDAIYKKYIGGKDAIKNAPINDLYAEGLAEAVDAIWELPSVTPTRPIGKWRRYMAQYKECSRCGKLIKYYYNYNYCPNCGAKMETETKIEQGLNYSDQDTMMPAT